MNAEVKDAMFPMHTKEGVETFLTSYVYLRESMFYDGDFDTLIRLIDFDKALLRSGLSNMELVVINLVFIEDVKRVDVAKHFNVTKQTVQTWISRATEKLSNYYIMEVGE